MLDSWALEFQSVLYGSQPQHETENKMSFVALFCGHIVLKNRIKSQTSVTKMGASSLFICRLKLELQQRMYTFRSSLKGFLGHLQFVRH